MVTKVAEEKIYEKNGQKTVFLQLARKIEMDHVDNGTYYSWLDSEKAAVSSSIPGAEIVEKQDARGNPPLNTAIYYDTDEMAILPTGALLRTSCNKITHAFCAFKGREDEYGVRRDNRRVFDGAEKLTIVKLHTCSDGRLFIRQQDCCQINVVVRGFSSLLF